MKTWHMHGIATTVYSLVVSDLELEAEYGAADEETAEQCFRDRWFDAQIEPDDECDFIVTGVSQEEEE